MISPTNSFVIIDTNAVIQAITEQYTEKKIQAFLKVKKCKIIVCTEVFAELFVSKKLPNKKWTGYTKNKIIENLKKSFGDRIVDYSTSDEVKSMADSLVEKYKSEGLHYPDSILLAIAKIKGWNNIISADVDFSNCCRLENVSCFNPNRYKFSTVIKKKDPFEILTKLQTNYSIKELEPEIIYLFEDLCAKWQKSNNIQSEHIFKTDFKKTISVLKFHDSIFKTLEKHRIDSHFVEKFFLNIVNGIKSYDHLVSSLKSKQELKKQNIQNLQDLLDK